ncbi:hypothetical protein ACLQ24_21090, partial [Micromonospora sp. DT4]
LSQVLARWLRARASPVVVAGRRWHLAARAARRITMRDGVVVADSAGDLHDRPPSVEHGRPETLVPAPSAEPRSVSGNGPGHPSGGSGGAAGATGRLPPEPGLRRAEADVREPGPRPVQADTREPEDGTA